MGFFSWDCKVCGHPLLCQDATEDKNEWMTQGVALIADGSILKGEYDGYGRLDEYDIGSNPEAYHEACYKLAGKPTEFEAPSRSSRDQGWFFEDNVHNMPEPQTEKDIPLMKMVADMNHQIVCNAYELSSLTYSITKAADAFEKSLDTEDNTKLVEELKGLVKTRNNINKKELQKRADRLNIDPETLKKIEETVKNCLGEKSLAYLTIRKIIDQGENMYRLEWDEVFYCILNMKTQELSDKKFIDGEED